MLKKLLHFITHEIWKFQIRQISTWQSFLIHQLRILLLAIRGFIEDRVQLRASALTYYSLLSVVPVLAMVFAIAKGFGMEDKLEAQIKENLAEQQDSVITKMIEFAQNLLENTKEGLIAGVGIILLLWSVIKVLGHIERAFNDIWRIKKSRSFFRKFSDYLSLMIIAPIIIIISSSATVFISTQVNNITETVPFFGYLSGIIFFFIKMIPYVLIWVLFSLLYILLPNTKVNIKYGLIAGIIAGTLFQLLQWVYVRFQLGMSGYNVIYGSFAALPLFLIWLRFSWFIVLLGAEISFSYQNIEDYEFDPEISSVSNYYKRTLTYLVVHHIVKNFEKGDVPLTASEISRNLEIPIRLVRDIIHNLSLCGIITETISLEPKEGAYQPALDINKITIQFVNEKLEKYGTDELSISQKGSYQKIAEIQKSIFNQIEKSPNNILMKDIS